MSIKDELNESYKEKKEAISNEITETKQEISESVSKGVKKTKSFFRKALIFSLIAAVIGLGLYMLYCNWTYSEGTRSGTLVKISEKGYLLKTYEGQLNLGGVTSGDDGLTGNIWEFSVTDEAVYQKLGTLEGKQVTLQYNEIIRAMPWQGDTEYFITGAELVQ